MHLYVWSDGIYCGLRSEDVKLCVLVLIGINEQGQKNLLAISDGVRESIQRWYELQLDLKERNFNAPKVALGDGAVGLWAALDEVYPQTRQQRFWVHKSANMLNSLPKSVQPNAEKGPAPDLDGSNPKPGAVRVGPLHPHL